MCLKKDTDYWKAKNTWRVPPIVIDVKSFSRIPEQADLKGEYQLVEGHSRLGYFLALMNQGILDKYQHEVFLLRSKVKI